MFTPPDGEAAGEHLPRGVEALQGGDVRAGHLVGDGLGQGDVQPLKHEEGPQRDQEARDAGLDHDPAVQEPDDQRKAQRDQHPDPGVGGELVAEQRGAQGRTGDGDARRQVELPADHQQRDRRGHQAVGRGDVQHAGERGRVPERRRDDEEENVDDDRADQRAGLGTGQQAGQGRLPPHPLIADRRRGDRSFRCLSHVKPLFPRGVRGDGSPRSRGASGGRPPDQRC